MVQRRVTDIVFSILFLSVLFFSTPLVADSDSVLVIDDLQAPQEIRCLGEDRGVLKTSVYSGGVGKIFGGERTVHCVLKNSVLPLGEVGTTAGLLMLDHRSSAGAVGVSSMILDGAGVGPILPGASLPEIAAGFKKPLDLSGYHGLVFQLFFDFALFQDSTVSFYLHSSPKKYSHFTLKLERTVRFENVFLPLKGAATGTATAMSGRYPTNAIPYLKDAGPDGLADLSNITGIRIAMNEDPVLGEKSSVDILLSGAQGGICAYAHCGTEECLTNSARGLQNGCAVR